MCIPIIWSGRSEYSYKMQNIMRSASAPYATRRREAADIEVLRFPRVHGAQSAIDGQRAGGGDGGAHIQLLRGIQTAE